MSHEVEQMRFNDYADVCAEIAKHNRTATVNQRIAAPSRDEMEHMAKEKTWDQIFEDLRMQVASKTGGDRPPRVHKGFVTKKVKFSARPPRENLPRAIVHCDVSAKGVVTRGHIVDWYRKHYGRKFNVDQVEELIDLAIKEEVVKVEASQDGTEHIGYKSIGFGKLDEFSRRK